MGGGGVDVMKSFILHMNASKTYFFSEAMSRAALFLKVMKMFC